MTRKINTKHDNEKSCKKIRGAGMQENGVHEWKRVTARETETQNRKEKHDTGTKLVWQWSNILL